MDKLLEHIPLAMGLFSFIGGVIAWYGATVKKQYAAERDFGHLKKSYESLAHNIGSMDRLFDQRFDELQRENLELKTLLQGILIRLGSNGSMMFNSKEP
ncbi:MAG: hypothetical protein AAFV46_00885 [Cyanobacteria bacterium J06635_11]